MLINSITPTTGYCRSRLRGINSRFSAIFQPCRIYSLEDIQSGKAFENQEDLQHFQRILHWMERDLKPIGCMSMDSVSQNRTAFAVYDDGHTDASLTTRAVLDILRQRIPSMFPPLVPGKGRQNPNKMNVFLMLFPRINNADMGYLQHVLRQELAPELGPKGIILNVMSPDAVNPRFNFKNLPFPILAVRYLTEFDERVVGHQNNPDAMALYKKYFPDPVK